MGSPLALLLFKRKLALHSCKPIKKKKKLEKVGKIFEYTSIPDSPYTI